MRCYQRHCFGRKGIVAEAISTIQNHGLSNESWFNNPHLEDLYLYSDFASFTEKLRPIFLELFNGAKRIRFPGCNGDSLLWELPSTLLSIPLDMGYLVIRVCSALTQLILDLVRVHKCDFFLRNASTRTYLSSHFFTNALK